MDSATGAVTGAGAATDGTGAGAATDGAALGRLGREAKNWGGS